MPRLWRGAFFSHHTYISVKNKGRFGESKSHSCPFLFSKICPEKYIVFVTTRKKWEHTSTAALIYFVYLTFPLEFFIMALVEPTAHSWVFANLCRRCTVKKTVAWLPARAERKASIAASRESNSEEVADMDILTIVGSICSIVGLAFAIHVYIKSKNEKKWAVCCSRWLTCSWA